MSPQPMPASEPGPRKPELGLTAEDVARLLEDKTPETLVEITGKIAGIYNRDTIHKQDAQAAEQIFRLLMRETEVRVRIALAENVKSSAQIPKDIALSLAKDVQEVALPMLQYSEVLDDEDLVELMSNTEEVERLVAVSKREHVSDALSDTLLARGNDEVASTLVNNSGAVISEQGFKRIIDYYPSNKTLMDAVGTRPHLPVGVAEKLVLVVSDKLADTIKKKYYVANEQIEQEVDKAREGETLNLVRVSQTDEEVDKLIGQLVAFNRLTPSIILSALCQGNFAFFETALARLSNIPVSNARTLITDRGELGFRAIYNKSGLPDAMFPAVKLLLRVVRELDTKGEKKSTSRYANRIVERLLQYSEEEPIDNLSYIIALVRRIAS